MADYGNKSGSNPYAGPVADLEDDLLDPDLYPEGQEGPLVYGTFWQRFSALILDSVFCGIILWIFQIGYVAYYVNVQGQIPMSADSKVTPEDIRKAAGFATGLYAIMFLGFFIYDVVFECSNLQATPGKRILGLKVTDLGGDRISFFRASVRHVCKFFSMFFYIGYIMQPFNDKKQALHDMMAGTLVVKR